MCALLGCFVGRASQSVVPDTVPTDASWQHHVAYVGIPPIASAVVAKEVQTVHPSARIRSGKGFKTEIDNYIQVEGGGTLTFESDETIHMPVPSTDRFVVDLTSTTEETT